MKQMTHIPKFRRFVIQNFPFIEEDFDALTDYALMSKIVEYLNNVIQSQNDVVDNVEELNAAFTTLHDYVEHYFDNLDVQQEINNKLDGLVADGTLEALIGNYIQPRIDAQNVRIDSLNSNITTFEGTVNGQLASFSNLISSVTNGSPLTASSTAGMTDRSKVYVNTTDGNWYYYDGTAWQIGGTYQSSGISNGSVKLTMLGSDVVYNINSRTNTIGRDIFEPEIILNLTDNLVNNDSGNNGTVGNPSTTRVMTNNLIYVPFGYALTVKRNTNNYRIDTYYFDENMVYKSNARIDDGASFFPLISSNEQRFIRMKFRKTDDGTIQPTDVSSSVTISFVQMLNTKTNNALVNDNLANEYVTVDGYLNNKTYPYAYIKSSSYKTMMPIKMEKGKTYHVSTLRKIAQYDNNFNYITDTFVDNATTNYSFTATQDGYFIVTKTAGSECMVNEGSTAVDYEPYLEQLPPYVQLKNVSNLSGLIASKNILTNKTYVALGDSFTHGDFTNAPEDNYHIEDGTYAGQYKVYPFLIGNRNDMNIVNLAQNGMTMTKINNVWSNYISNGVLANIPSSADYITIKIGINDNPNHKNATLGTINDDRDDTFYGRYNRVMTYLITNFPDAKIGIIISNGQTSLDFVNAAIAIAKKYGVAYLNETTDDNVPLLIRTLRTDVDNSIKTLRNNHWYVSTTAGSTNSHPNAACHEYESTIVENFLRSL